MTQETGLATIARDEAKRIERRLDLALAASPPKDRYGNLVQVSAELRGVIVLLAYRYQLDPLTDIEIYEGAPFVTSDGWYRIMRRNPEYKGHVVRPLVGEAKVAWGFEPDDLALECTIYFRGDRLPTVGHGVVRADEVKRARAKAEEKGKQTAPIGRFVTEIAEKRAIARTARVAFGLDEVSEGDSPAGRRWGMGELAAEQVRIMGTEESYWPTAPGDDKGSVDPYAGVIPGEEAGELGWAEAATSGSEPSSEAPKPEQADAPAADASPEPGDPPVTVYSCNVCDVPLYHPDGTAVTKEEVETMQKRYGAILCKKDQRGR